MDLETFRQQIEALASKARQLKSEADDADLSGVFCFLEQVEDHLDDAARLTMSAENAV